MNNLTRSALVSLIALTGVLFAACNGNQTGGTTEPPQTHYTTAVNETRATVAPAAADNSNAVSFENDQSSDGSFRSAIWLASDCDTEDERFYVFLDDTHGKIIEQKNGQETPFSCVLTGDNRTITLGGEAPKAVTVFWSDDTHAVIRWGTEKAESLTFLRDNANEPLHFFNDEQLCAMALNHYEQIAGVRPAHARAFYNYDEMISIQLYDNEGAVPDTFDWYTIDRYTGEGFNSLNEPVNLAGTSDQPGAAQTTAVTAQTTAVTQQTTAAPAQTTAAATAAPIAETTAAEVTEAPPAESLPEETAAPSETELLY